MMYFQNYFNQWATPFHGYVPLFVGGTILILLLIWSFLWKGMALWKAARRGDKGWFIVLLVVNTAGILEILYIYVFGKDKKQAT